MHYEPISAPGTDTVPVIPDAVDVLWLVDTDLHRLRYLSPRFQHLWGHPPGDLYDDFSRIFTSLHENDWATASAALNAWLEDGCTAPELQQEYRIIRPDGTERWVRSVWFPLRGRHGEVVRLAGAAADITARKSAEATVRYKLNELARRADTMNVEFEPEVRGLNDSMAPLLQTNTVDRRPRESDQLLERIFSTEFMLIAYLDTDFNFIRVNKAFAAADGKAPADFIGKNHFDLYPDTENEAIFRRVAAEGRPHFCFAGTNENAADPGSNVSFWDWSLQPVKDADGAVVGLVFLLLDVTKRIRADAAHRRSEALFRAIIEQTGEGVAIVNADGRYVLVNPRFCDMLGYSEAELLETNIKDLLLPGVEPEVFPQAVNNQSVIRERELRRKDGSLVPVELTGYPLQLAPERFALLITRDISRRRQAEAEMHKLSSALRQTADSVMVTDREGIIEYINPAFEATTGYSRDEVLGRKPNIIKSGKHDSVFYSQLWETVRSGGVYRDILINRKKDGSLYYEEKTITPLKNAQGDITHFVSTGKDITERMQIQERLHYLAHHDVVTGLPNRLLFMERLTRAIARTRRAGRSLAVLFLDLDRFKTINDTLGHDVGDQVLQESAQRLLGCIREGDTLARLGGDEFTILLEDVTGNDVPLVVEKLLRALAGSFQADGCELFVTGSIGIGLFPGDGEDAQDLLKNADAAMYLAKDSGRNRYRFYSADINAKAFERLTLETALRYALQRNELLLHYQPLIDLRTGKVTGVEALLRWQHPQLGLVKPARFIPILEETGLIVQVGEWVLLSACRQAQRWRQQGLGPIRISVNLSARQFTEPNLIDMVRQCLEQSGLPPELVELEITESVIMHNAQSTIDTLKRLNAMGVRLAVDDFGTGYSSLSYLKRFPINTLKIDKSFISDLATSPDDAAIIKAIIAMAHNLKLDVVAEGVETDVQRLFLGTCACDSVQGFLFSVPLTEQGATGLLRQWGGEPE